MVGLCQRRGITSGRLLLLVPKATLPQTPACKTLPAQVALAGQASLTWNSGQTLLVRSWSPVVKEACSVVRGEDSSSTYWC